MTRENCRQFMDCGRQPGGARQTEYGVCPVFTNQKFDGYNHGQHAGRYCWMVEGTLCQDRIQGNWAQKMRHCLTKGEFFKHVQQEEGAALKY